MSYANAAVTYREREVLTASPGKLVVIIFDHLLVNIRRAKIALETGKVEMRVEALGKARAAVMELLMSTDVERGGAIAQNLRSLYVFVFNELMSIRQPTDAARLDRISGIALTLRDAFATTVVDVAAQSPAA